MTFLKKTKMILTSLTLITSMLLIGCGETTSSTTDSVKIEGLSSDLGEIKVGTTYEFEKGSIEASEKIGGDVLEWTVKNEKGEVKKDLFDLKHDASVEPAEKLDVKEDLKLQLEVKGNAENGKYTLELTATVGTATQTQKPVFTVTGGVDPDELKTKDVTLGSFNNPTLGSSLDADDMEVYLVKAAKENSEKIDIWYENQADGGNVLYSIQEASKLSSTHATKSFSTKNSTPMAKITEKFEDITSQAKLDELWEKYKGDTKEKQRCNPNDVVILKTSEGNIRLLLFIEGDGTDKGKAMLKGKF